MKSEDTDRNEPSDSELKRTGSISSLRASFRSSKMKLDEFLKTPRLSKRKRYTVNEESSKTDLDSEEPCQKKSMLSRISMSNLMSPVRTVKKVSDALQKSFSIHNLKSPQASSKQHQATPYRRTTAAASLASPSRSLNMFWHQTVDNSEFSRFDKQQVERQEAIYELYKSEVDLISDLEMVKTTYRDSMKKLGLLTDAELEQIFGQIDSLVPLHQALVDELKDQRLPDGTTDNVGKVLLNWVPGLQTYASYCSNQVYAKALLDTKKRDPAVEDFLQRCQDSPFSRRLDLWSFLDVPRSRLVKYPLLFKSIQKHTPSQHEDNMLIDQALDIIDLAIKEVDRNMGQSKCQFAVQKLEYLDERQNHPFIKESEFIICDGLLKNSRGNKLHVFLFDKILVLTRRSSRGDEMHYQVYRQPIPLMDLCVDSLTDAQQTQRGSFRNAFSQNQSVKHSFKVSNKRVGAGHSYVLQANDEQNLQHWLQCLHTAIQNFRSPLNDDAISTISTAKGVSRGSSFYNDDGFSLEDTNSFMGSCSSLSSVFSVESSRRRMNTRSRTLSSKSSGDEDSSSLIS